MNKRTAITFGLAALASMSFAAQAATTNSSSAKASSFIDRISSKFTATFFGSQLNDPLNSHLFNDQTGVINPKASIFAKEKLHAMYKINDDMQVGPVFYWKQFAGWNGNFKLADSYVRFSHGNLLTRGNFNISAGMNVYLPTSQGSQDLGTIATLEPSIYLSYAFPNSRFTLDQEFTSTNILHDTNGEQDGSHYTGTTVGYQLSKKVKIWGLVEYAAAHVKGDGFNFATDYFDFEPGLDWQISNRVKFSPFLNMNLRQEIGASTTNVCASLSIKLL